MNFKKPKMENLTGALVTGGSAVAGAAASNLLVAELTKTCFRPWLPLSRTTRRLGLCRPA